MILGSFSNFLLPRVKQAEKTKSALIARVAPTSASSAADAGAG